MDKMNQTVCPKCNYARTAADSAPAWQCPSCGIAYSKFKDAAGPKAGEGTAARGPAADLRVQTLSVGGGSDTTGGVTLMIYGGVLVLFLLLALLAGPFPQLFGVMMMWLPVSFAVCAFLFWLSAYRRLRMVEDVPTSTVAAAAQGYIELRGTAVAAPGDALIGQLTGEPCIWYRYSWIKTRGTEKEGESGERGVPFILRDATGDCLIDSARAEVTCDRCQTWTTDALFQEWSIRVGDPVYAIGYFLSGGAAAERHVNIKVAYALSAQERDKEAYATQHDANRDGKVDRRETAVARDALRRDAMKEYVGQGGVHVLGPSPDGRPFLVIGARHGGIASRYRRLAAGHLCVFFISLGVGAYIWRMW